MVGNCYFAKYISSKCKKAFIYNAEWTSCLKHFHDLFSLYPICTKKDDNCIDNFSTTKTGISWKDRTYYRKLRIQGEWIKINCAIRISGNVHLWFGKRKGETTKKLKVDNEKIKLVSKNVFNITNLTTEDHGWYTCQVCRKKHAKFLEVPHQGT